MADVRPQRRSRAELLEELELEQLQPVREWRTPRRSAELEADARCTDAALTADVRALVGLVAAAVREIPTLELEHAPQRTARHRREAAARRVRAGARH